MTVEELMKSWGTFLTLYTNNSVFRNNMELLSQISLGELGQNIAYDAVMNVTDLYRRNELDGEVWQPEILGIEETLDMLLENPQSICRFGDAEINLMRGIPAKFQVYDKNLVKRLMEILESGDNFCKVGLQKSLFHWPKERPQHAIEWLLKSRMILLNFLDAHANKTRQYIDTDFSLIYMNNSKSDLALHTHYEKMLRLFEGKRLVMFAGKDILAGLSHNIFERAASMEIIHCPPKNAYFAYNDILAKARSYPKDVFTLCFILGPTATIAAWDLAKEGYLVWDLGHIAKDYDAYCNKLGKTGADFENFFAPD